MKRLAQQLPQGDHAHPIHESDACELVETLQLRDVRD
jgi:hypothetical protein